MTAPEILKAARSGQLDLLYLVGQDLWPGECEAKFVIVQDMFLPIEAGKVADVVFPVAGFAEVEATTTNFEGRVQRLRQAVEPTVLSKPDWQILSDLARELGASGFEYAGSSEIMAELARSVPFYKGATHEALDKGAAFFGSSKRKKAPPPEEDAKPKRAPRSETPDRDYPFALVVEFDEYAYKATPLSSEVRGLRRLERGAAVELSSKDAEAMGIGPDAPVNVISRRGRVTANALLSQNVQPGTARMVARGGEASPAHVLGVLLDPASKSLEEICAVQIEKM
jgi:predicted molibdopterin-dependent oxidoreductase YjgC